VCVLSRNPFDHRRRGVVLRQVGAPVSFTQILFLMPPVLSVATLPVSIARKHEAALTDTPAAAASSVVGISKPT
jgi:hypothetical protein